MTATIHPRHISQCSLSSSAGLPIGSILTKSSEFAVAAVAGSAEFLCVS